LQGDYRWPLTPLADLDVETDYNWQSSTQYQLAETAQTIQGDYGIWNASLGVLFDRFGFTARFLVKNITNQHYSSYLANGTEGSTGVVRWVPRDDSRYVGVDLRKTF
jgi:iron complex outermembrane receptor protein